MKTRKFVKQKTSSQQYKMYKIALPLIVVIFVFTLSIVSLYSKKSYNAKAEVVKKTAEYSPNYIIGGTNVKDAKKWPFIGRLIYKNDLQYTKKPGTTDEYDANLLMSSFCAGSLISKNIILTAEHCVKYQSDVDPILVAFGFTNLVDQSINNKDRFILRVTRIIHKPDFTFIAGKPVNDIALLVLGENYITKKMPESMPEHISLSDWTGLDYEKTPAIYIGYGMTETTIDNPFLKDVLVAIVSNKRGNKPTWYDGRIKDSMILAGFPLGGKDACGGDSGGPVVQFTGGYWILSGIVSSGGDVCGAPYKPGINTRVRSFLPWIEEQTGIKPLQGTFIGKGLVINEEYKNRMKEFDEDNNH